MNVYKIIIYTVYCTDKYTTFVHIFLKFMPLKILKDIQRGINKVLQPMKLIWFLDYWSKLIIRLCIGFDSCWIYLYSTFVKLAPFQKATNCGVKNRYNIFVQVILYKIHAIIKSNLITVSNSFLHYENLHDLFFFFNFCSCFK